MKSELYVVRGLAAAIFEDLCHMYPSIHQSLRRDLSRLQKADSVAGLPVYTITLPDMVKYLQRSLDMSKLDDPRPPLLGAKSKVDRRPSFLYGLWSKIFEQDGTLRTSVDVDAIFALRQIFLFAKKLRIECGERYTKSALSQFRDIEKYLPQPWEDTWTSDSPRWDRRFGHPIWGEPNADDSSNDMFDPDPMSRYDLDLDWSGFRNFVARAATQFGSVDVYGLRDESGRAYDASASDPYVLRPKHGPGAVSDKREHTKYDQLYWTHRLEPVFPYDWFGSSNLDVPDYVIYREFPSRLLAVPKTQSGPRLIAAEPTAHQWMQGAMERWLTDACKRSFLNPCIDFSDQAVSRRLAREASSSGSHATVDLSSASDRLSCRLVEFCFQSNRSLLDALHACRTRVVAMPGDDEKDLIMLRKFATQGSAVTFPVQTIVYTLISIWALGLARGLNGDVNSVMGLAPLVRVFGDDIIVPTDAYPVLVRMLSSLLLKVNESKSYARGKFRESCGEDAYDGVDVTPAYLRQVYGPAPESLASVVECSNNFFMKGWWHAAAYVQKTVPEEEARLLPILNARTTGPLHLTTFTETQFSHLRKRWNKELQRDEYRVIHVSSSPRKKRGKGYGDLNQFFHTNVRRDDLINISLNEGGQVTEARVRKSTRWAPYDEYGEENLLP